MSKQRPTHIEQASDWVWAFAAIALMAGLSVHFCLVLLFDVSALVATPLAIVMGLLVGIASAQIAAVRKVVGGLVEALIFWTP